MILIVSHCLNSCLGQIVLVRQTSGNHSQPDFVAKQNGKTRIVSTFAKGLASDSLPPWTELTTPRFAKEF
ncbi:hypothetical protein RBWH47_00782 [Rhodopirellula baltica WH47]|uniref:Uncharacterized protein n=1 Tax=Rhodopirellula baltica WH47 TaxID=991778 RepID=F2B094_RHOBT|nr:hypothetical protein RBWH47_00782 [Rhodopirellula baltica WH47]